MSHLIAPSMLSADFANLERDILMVNHSEADWFHIDVMDGVYVPNISFGFPVIKAIKKLAAKPLDVHLMIVDPDRYVEEFKNAGADMLSVHYEACTHLNRTLSNIKKLGMKAGVVLNPHTPVALLKDIVYLTDLIMIMSVNPGYGGQSFIPNTLSRIGELRNLVRASNPEVLIEVDGGITLNNARSCIDAGADILVAGNTVFASRNPLETIKKLKKI